MKTHCGWSAVDGTLICGADARRSFSALIEEKITCKRCLAILLSQAESDVCDDLKRTTRSSRVAARLRQIIEEVKRNERPK